MAYTKTNWQDGVTPLSAANMNKIEQGIKDAHDAIDNIELTADRVEVDNPHFSATNVDEALTELFTSGSSGKTMLRDALTAKGVPVADADSDGIPSFAELKTAIDTPDFVRTNVSNGATAGQILSGRRAVVNGGEVIGTMPNRTGHVTGQSISQSGTTLRIRP